MNHLTPVGQVSFTQPTSGRVTGNATKYRVLIKNFLDIKLKVIDQCAMHPLDGRVRSFGRKNVLVDRAKNVCHGKMSKIICWASL